MMQSLCYILLLLLVLLNIEDIRTTHFILRNGGRELNKVVGWFIARFGLLPGLIIAKVLVLAPVIYYVAIEQMPVWLLFPLVVLYSWVVWYNRGQV